MTERNDLGLTATGASGGGCSCCSPSSTAGAPASPSAVTAEVMVSGMTCSHCVASVTEELGEVPGVEGIDVDLNAGGLSRVTIRSAEPIDDAAITAAIEEAGYAREDVRS